MNEKVLQDLYNRAVSLRYKGGLEDFRTLIQTNQQVQDDNYAYVQSQGYKGAKEDFLRLLGMGQTTSTIPLKKKESAPNMGSSLADGSLEPSMPETTKRTLNQVGIGVRKLPDVRSFSQMPPPMQVEEAFNLIQGRGYKGTKEEFIAEYGIEIPQTQEEMYAKKDIFNQNIQNAFNAAARYSPTKVETKTVPAKVEPTMQEQAKQQFEEQFPKTLERIKQAPEEARKAGEYLQTVKESERQSELDRMKANQQDEEFMRLVSGIDNLTIKMSEEQAVPVLNERFKKYGIVFSEAVGGRNVLLARTADGKSSVEIPLTAFGSEGVLGERAKKLRDFIISNSKKADETMTEDYITKSARAQTMRRVGRLNADGSVSTVKFMSFEEDGKFKVAPTLFPKDPLNYGSRTSDWLELSPNDAIEEARRRGEIFEFKTKAEAEKFANGGWKEVTKSDIEGHKFFKDRGLDYFDYKTQRDELLAIDKEAAFISEVSNAIKEGKVNNAKQYYMKYASPEEAIKYMYLLSGNNLRPDIESYQEKRQDQKNELFAQVEDRTFFSDGKVQTAFEDFDLHLNNRAKVVSAEATELKKQVKTKYQELDAVSMEAFGVPVADLYSYKPKNQAEVLALNDIRGRLAGLSELNKIAAEKYYSAQTYFDSKVNKAIQNEFEENMAGFWGEVNSAYENGKAGYELMKYALGASTVEEASEMISDAISNSESSSKSRAFQAFMSAGTLRGDERAQRAFWSDPFEVTLSLIATSMSQLLPIGLRVLPTTIGTGAAVGAGVGSSTASFLGPFAIGPTAGGALQGVKHGYQVGMAIVNFAAEYTQSVLDAARESGYNISDGNSMAEALNDPEVWRKGNDIGIKRGIAIGAIDYLSSRLTGGIFKVSKLASKPMKFGAQFAERGLYDPAMEGFGELVAQKWSTGEIDEKEVEAEMLGGVGNNSVNAGMGVMFSALRNTNLDLANSLTNVSTVAQESASDERISNWASNMRRLGQIDAEVEQRIQRNVGLRREARDVLSVGENGKTAAKDSKLQARIMELMQARDEMSATTNRREVYRNQIAAVNEEIREIAETKKLRPAESQVNLQGINAPTAPKGVGVYKVNGTPMTKEKFLSTVSRMRGSRFNRSRIVVDNDPETEKLILKLKQDAIQKQSTAQVPTQSEATVGEGVGEQVPGEEVVAGEGQEVSTEETKGKIAETRSRLDELKSSIPAPVAVTPEIIQQVQSESLAPEQLDGVLSSLADAVISGEELAPEQQALVSANKARVDELVSLKSEQEALSSEVSDLETMLSQSGGFQFRAKEGVTTTRDANWDAKTKEELPASSFESDEAFQSTVRDGQWGMLTAENPDAKQVSDAENEAANKRAEEWLRSRGYNPQRIFGKYGNSENSFFVDGLTTEDAVEFAREFSQESVATDKGLVYQDGKMNPRKKGEETFAPADDFYSTIKIGDKLSDFSVSYDFDEKTDSGVKPAPKAGPQFRAGEDAGISIVDGWYSTIEKNLRETKIEKQSANKWLSGGFIGKGDEAIYTGVKGWLESKNPQEQVSKQEILDWMKDNRVEIVEVVKGGDKSKKDLLEELGFTFSRTEDNRYKINIPEGADSSDYGFPSIVGNSYEQVAEMAVDLAGIDLSGKQDAKYTQYQLEGEKENYKEVLVTLPSKELPEGYKVETVTLDNGDVVYRANGDGLSTPHKTYQEAENELKERAKDFYGTGKLGGAKFKSTHFDEPNILVHLRMNTRTDADGNKVLFLEEIQSDWGQKGKKEGFAEATPESIIKAVSDYNKIVNEKKELLRQAADYVASGKLSELQNKVDEINSRLEDAKSKLPNNAVVDFDSEFADIPVRKSIPPAPFVTDTNAWTKLGLKIALREAVAQGATKIAWTTGEQQNERFDLSEQLDSVEVSKDETGMYKILGKKDGETVASRFAETPQEMESFIGKELTDKIISSNIPSGGTKIFSGVDLKVGGKGMKGFYDKIVPDVAKALVKELTGKKVEVGETRIGTITKQKIDKSLQKELKKGNYTIYQEGDVWKLKTKGTLLRTPYRTEAASKELLENWVKNQLSDGTTTQQSIDITPELKAQVQRGMPLFRIGTKLEQVQEIDEDAELERIVGEMNELDSPLVEFSAGTEVDTDVETDVDELNSKLDTPLEKVSIEILNGVPVLTTISDYLVASNEGVTDPVTGNKILKLFGGLGFNGIERFAKAAWANVSRPKANEQVRKAREIYNNNKEVIEKFWADNPKYDGMVPMLVVKMGEDSILSNEALSRVVVDRIKSINLSKTKKEAAFKELKRILINAKKKYAEKENDNNLRKKRGEPTKKIDANTIHSNTAATFILENSSSLDEALQRIFELPISPRAALIKMITSGSALEKRKTFNPPTNKFIKAIIGKTKNNALLHIQSIIDVIADPSVANVPIGSVTSIVGVKVAEKQPDGSYKEAGGVINVDHPNYQYGAEGMSFGVLSKPLPVQSVMPSAYGAIIGKNIAALSTKKKPLAPSIALGVGYGLSEFMGRFVSNNRTKAMQLISLINRTFPNVSVYTTAEAFNNIIAESGTRLQMKGDAILYGVTANGDIYINPDVHNSESDMFNTVIHEFGHVWLNMLATSEPGSKGRQLLERGISVLKEGIKTDPKLKAMFERQMEEFDGNEAAALNEMLAILIGNKGQQISDAATKSKFQEFLFAMWEYVRNKFKMSKDLSIEEIQDLSLDKFIETAIADMIQGEDMKISDKQLESMRSLTAMARAEDSMQSIIDLGRANGFSDQSIKEILLRRGFKAGDINTALEVKVDLMTNLPQSFTNVQGGVKEGMKMYADVRQQLSKYARKKVKEADGKERTRTMSEVRQKAIELLKDHPIFKAQAKIVQDELLIGFDQSLSTRANRSVDAQISQIKKGLAAKKMGIKELAAAQKKLIDFISDVLPQTSGFSPARIERLVRLVGSTDVNNFNAQAERVLNLIEKQKELMAKKEIEAALKAQRKEIRDMRTGRKQLLAAQIQLKNYIRKTLPKSSAFTQAQINRLISAITNTTLDNFSEQAQKVLDVVARQLTKMSKAKVKEISAIINKAAKISSTQSGKRRAGRVDADTQSLFATMKSVFRAITMEARDGDSSAIDRIMDSVDPAVLASKGIDLDVVQQKLDNGEELTSQERAAFNTTVALQELEVVRDFLTGVTSAGVSPSPWQHMEALNMLAQRLKEIASEGIVRLKADKLVLSNEISSLNQQATDQIKSGFGILYNEDGTLKGKNQLAAERRMIWENFRSLKIWEGIKGWVKTIDFQTVTGFHDFMRKKIYHLGTLSNILDKGGDFFKKNVYDALNRMDEATKRGYFNQIVMLDGLARANGFKNYKDFTRSLSGPPVFLQVGTYKSPLNLDQILRLYALSKNDVQRKKLVEMGIDINEIEAALTDKQKAVADGVVDYLSNSYFDSVNNVYSYVNNVNLGYVSNYFPTKTIQTRIDGKVLESGDFGSTFNAETAPALKERTDTKGEIDIDGADFTSVLDAHFRSMEKYKAMAVGVRKITQIFKLQDVVTLLEQTGTKPMIMRTLNFAINPESMTREPSTFVGKLASKFTGFALAFKAIQILKQGSSFVQAFEDYTVRKGKPTPVLDHIMFMVDMAYIIATLPKQIKKAYNMSANVKDRLDQGLEGDVYGLESGTGLFRPISKSSSAWAKARRAFKTGAAAPTVLGDITGVLGYMAVYNRMIKQGFTQAEALEAFNNYNATQQSRRATEKSPIQMSNNEFQRLFTMFGSTVFLMMNKTAQTSTNIMRSISKGKMPKAKDVRGLMLNVAIANVLFVGAANIAKFIKGDEEDKEEALKAMRNAMLGLNLIYSIPLIGSAVETMVSYAEGDFRKADDTVNPFMSLFRKYQKSKQYLSEGEVWGATQPIIEIIIGAQLDPFIGIYNYFSTSDQKEEDAAMYDMLGITSSYRPDTEEKQQGGMNKEDMKRYFPDLYDDVYGPNSPGYDVREEIKEMDREIDKEMQAIKDEAYGK